MQLYTTLERSSHGPVYKFYDSQAKQRLGLEPIGYVALDYYGKECAFDVGLTGSRGYYGHFELEDDVVRVMTFEQQRITQVQMEATPAMLAQSLMHAVIEAQPVYV